MTMDTAIERSPFVIQTDVAVLGGGTSGCLAAMAAAEAGAAVVVVERDNALGGVGTRSGLFQYHWGSLGGFQNDLDRECDRMAKALGVEAVGFSPDIKRIVLNRCFQERGIRVLYRSAVYSVDREGGTIVSVCAATPTGICEIRARVYVDATGDADVLALAGGSFTQGRESDGNGHPLSLVPRILNRHGAVAFRNFDGGWVDSADPQDITRALVESRQWIWDCYRDDGHVLGISPQLGVREGRHAVGDYSLSMEDYVSDRTYDDTVVRTYSHYDNHARDFGNENDFCQIWVVILGLLKQPLSGDVPYRCLLPLGIDNLLIAGRAFSAHRDVFAGIRMQRDMQKLGEAAGVAAALAARGNGMTRDVPIGALQRILVRRGVLKQEDLQRVDTPNLSLRSGLLAGIRLRDKTAGQHLPELASYLGQEEEGVALWWISKTGQAGAEFIRNWMNGSSAAYEQRRAAAFGLALLGDRHAVAPLMEVLTARDPYCPPPPLKPIPRWTAAIVALRLLKAREALPEVCRALGEPHPPGLYSFMLGYFRDMAPLFGDSERHRVVQVLSEWLDGRLPHIEYELQGGKAVSYAWNLELHAADVLAACGEGRWRDLCRRYLTHESAMVRQFAGRVMQSRERGDGRCSLPGHTMR